jgi:hypothetical protein
MHAPVTDENQADFACILTSESKSLFEELPREGPCVDVVKRLKPTYRKEDASSFDRMEEGLLKYEYW